MPSVNPPYPSFTLVMSNNMGNSGTSRPPAYRGFHSGRYHPYPRTYPSHYEDYMATVDYRYSEPPQARQRSSFALPAIIVEDCDLEIEAGDADDTDTAAERRARLNMNNIGDYIMAFVLAVRRKCRRALTVKNIEDELRFEFVN